MLRPLPYIVTCLLWLAPTAHAEGFAGWQALRVIEQEGSPARMRATDLDGDGRGEIIVVNPRHARLDVYAWASTDQADVSEGTSGDAAGGEEHVNDLPMAAELTHTEVPVRQPPIDVRPLRWGEDPNLQLLVLVSGPNKLLRLAYSIEDDKWSTQQSWDLLPGRYAGSGEQLKVVDSDDGTATVLISGFDGIQQLTLQPGADEAVNRRARARWLEPREAINRNDWWLADLDGDGADDLVEWTGDTSKSLRWYPAPGKSAPTAFRPAQTLYDRGVAGVALLDQPAGLPDELIVLENQPEGAVRLYRLSEGEASPLGQQEPLALPGGGDAVWAGMTINGKPTLVVADPGQPRVTLYHHDAGGWRVGESYPVVADVSSMIPLPNGGLLLLTEDGGDVFWARWDDDRLTFPRPRGWDDGLDESLILGAGIAGRTVWIIQKADRDLRVHLHRGDADRGPHDDGFGDFDTVTYRNAAGKAERALWLGDALLIADKFAKGLRLVRPGPDASGDAVSVNPAALARAGLDEFRPVAAGDGPPVPVRLTDGVWQRLDEDLVAVDQVMLPDGRRLIDFVVNHEDSLWVLQQGGGAIHRLVPDDAGVPRVETTTRIEGGRSLAADPVLGLLVVTGQGVTRLSEGRPLELEVVQSLDARAGRPGGVRDATVHRVIALDVDGDGRGDTLLADDVRHQLTALGQGEASGELSPIISWPVFEDQTYPYGGQGDELVREPRAVVALDLDGDGGQDLAMLSHDRLLIYLAQDPRSARDLADVHEEHQHD
ncbi:MAG: hypothetical protein AAF333_03725 [Planctomycetota bacterium]